MSRRKKPQRRGGRAPRAALAAGQATTAGGGPPSVAAVVDALRAGTGKDVRMYKPTTLLRRVEYRMGLHGLGDVAGYVSYLRRNKAEAEALLKDLLINVTRFFRDPEAFAAIAGLIGASLRRRGKGREYRVWVPGCSTGEEAYTLGIVLLEQTATLGWPCAARIYATDVDEEVLATGRAGLYPESIKADLGPGRLARFFIPEDGRYKVRPELEQIVTFGRHDLLADPPFSRLNLVSCRNMLIYLAPDAQRRVLSAFDFGLEKDGLLMLGPAESPGVVPDMFEMCDEGSRIFRKPAPEEGRPPDGAAPADPPGEPRMPALQTIVERMMLQTYGPASVVVNRHFEPVYFFGEVDPYLKITPGQPNQDLLSMARDGLRADVRDAVLRTLRTRRPVSVHRVGVKRGLALAPVTVDAQCLSDGAGDLVLVSFIDEPDAAPPSAAGTSEEAALRKRLDEANRQLAAAAEERDVLKEELQSLTEELQTVNGQLRDTLARRKPGTKDIGGPPQFDQRQLQMMIDMMPDAVLATDREGRVRAVNERAERLFGYAAAELVGQPAEPLFDTGQRGGAVSARIALAEKSGPPPLRAGTSVAALTKNGSRVPVDVALSPVESAGEPLVLAVIRDMWRTVQAQEALEAARRASDQANIAKSRFIAAANHDLRQPLQAIALLHGVLEQQIINPLARETLAKLDGALAQMTEITNSLIDLNQIESGEAAVELSQVSLGPLLTELAEEFAQIAAAKGLELRCVPATATLISDLRLLTRILRNLLSKAIKYTHQGKVLLGCRRQGSSLRIEVWDTSDGLAAANLEAIFEEFHRIDRSDGGRFTLGLDLYLVQRSAELLGFGLDVYSSGSKGSMFAVIVPDALRDSAVSVVPGARPRQFPSVPVILLVQPDASQRLTLQSLLGFHGYHAIATSCALEATSWLQAHPAAAPSAMIIDDALSGGPSGLELVRRIRGEAHAGIPVLLLGSEGAGTLGGTDRVQVMAKPVKPAKLIAALDVGVRETRPDWQGGEPKRHHAALPAIGPEVMPDIAVIDDDPIVCLAIRSMVETLGHKVRVFSSAEAFLADPLRNQFRCLIVDTGPGGMDGLDLQKRLKSEQRCPPMIFLSGSSDVHLAVDAIRNGAADFMIKPVRAHDLRESLERILAERSLTAQPPSARADVVARLATLTNREREIMEKLLTGELNKNIAADLGISERTTEHHRQSLMRKMGVKSLAMLVRMIAAAEGA